MGFLLRKTGQQRHTQKSSYAAEKSKIEIQSRALGNSVTDIFSDLQGAYDHWITTSGAGGNLAQKVPDRFSTAEHLLYDDYQIVGEHYL